MRLHWRLISRGALCAALYLSWGPVAFGQQTPSCAIEITMPKKGARVGVRGQITGTATVPPGMHLWVFGRKMGQRNWWPQGGGNVEVRGGRWIADGAFGDEADRTKDAGSAFQLTGVIVDAESDAKLTSYVEATERSGRYPGTQLPSPAETGCFVKEEIVVTRQ